MGANVKTGNGKTKDIGYHGRFTLVLVQVRSTINSTKVKRNCSAKQNETVSTAKRNCSVSLLFSTATLEYR